MASAQKKSGNRLIDALPAEVRTALRPHFRKQSVELRHVLYEQGRKIQYAYFPIHCLISVVAGTADGDQVEIGMAGCEGMCPVGPVLRDDVPAQKAVVQSAGDALVIKAAELREAFATYPILERLLLRYTQSVLNAAAQTAACNRLHDLEQRCARWLLMAHDRTRGNEISITHDFLSSMLGVRRAGVTEVAQSLQADGLIYYRHGTILVRNRGGLEAASCECYGLISSDYERLIVNRPRA